MVVRHNMSAMFAQRYHHVVVSGKKKTTEKLASGYRVNRASDDAAGLSISEKMRNQIRGLNQAIKNIEDGMSLIQTADGALNEVHSILHRIGELSVKSANDTNAEEDRKIINDEVAELKNEIADIFEKTEFNGKGLFTTSYIQPGSIVAGAVNGVTIAVGGQSMSTMKYVDEGKVVNDSSYYFSTKWTATVDGAGDYVFSYEITDKDSGKVVSKLTDTIMKTDFRKMCQYGSYCDLNLTDEMDWNNDGFRDYAYMQFQMIGNAFQPSQSDLAITDPAQYEAELDAYENSIFQNLKNADVHMSKKLTYSSGTKEHPIMKDLDIQSGANAGNITEVEWKSLNLDVIGLSVTNVLTHTTSQNAIKEVQEAIRIVSAERSNFGAIQNRLEKTLNNNQNYVENLQSAESQIRDADFGDEILLDSKYNILQQVAQSMLAQANQDNESVLSLMQ